MKTGDERLPLVNTVRNPRPGRIALCQDAQGNPVVKRPDGSVRPLEELTTPETIRNTVGLTAGQSAIPADEDGKLPSERMPSEIDARISVLAGSRDALQQAPLGVNELAINTDDGTLVRGLGGSEIAKISGGGGLGVTMIVAPNDSVQIKNISVLGGYSGDSIPVKGVIVGSKVQVISDEAFSSNSAFTYIEIPESVVSIGVGAFSETNLVRLELPFGMTEVPEQVARGCPNLEEVILPSSIVKIKANALDNNPKLRNLQLPKNLIELETDALAGLTQDTLVLPEGLQILRRRSLGDINIGDKTLIIPESIQIIGMAFMEYSNIETLILPNSLTIIPVGMCNMNAPLKNVTLGNAVTHIGAGAFGFTSISTIKLPDTVTHIAANAFSTNWDGLGGDLTTVFLNSSELTIAPTAFVDSGLVTVYIGPQTQAAGIFTMGPAQAFFGAPNVTIASWDNYPDAVPN